MRAPARLGKLRFWRSPPDQPRWARPALLAVAALAAAAAGYAWNIRNVTLEPFCGAAARSMSQSWHNFIFGAFDRGGPSRSTSCRARCGSRPALAGIDVELVDERGTSSTCPRCGARVAKPKGRTFHCRICTLVAHRDLVGAANIAPRGSRGGDTFDLTRLEIMHRRAGRHLPGRTRRDPRRISMDNHRREQVDLWPAVARPETIGESLGRDASAT
jgi:hypothetical protein